MDKKRKYKNGFLKKKTKAKKNKIGRKETLSDRPSVGTK